MVLIRPVALKKGGPQVFLFDGFCRADLTKRGKICFNKRSLQCKKKGRVDGSIKKQLWQ